MHCVHNLFALCALSPRAVYEFFLAFLIFGISALILIMAVLRYFYRAAYGHLSFLLTRHTPHAVNFRPCSRLINLCKS